MSNPKPEVVKALVALAESEGKIKGEMRKTYWTKLAPKADFESTSAYASSLAQAIIKAGFVEAANEKALTGLFIVLGAGNQSQLRQLFEAQAEKVDCPF